MTNKSEQNQLSPEEKNNQKIVFYDRLKDELEKNTDWPTKYMYKFIMPNKEGNLQKLEANFDSHKIDIKKNFSKTGKYISVTVITEEQNPQAVINRYKAMENIDGLIAL